MGTSMYEVQTGGGKGKGDQGMKETETNEGGCVNKSVPNVENGGWVKIFKQFVDVIYGSSLCSCHFCVRGGRMKGLKVVFLLSMHSARGR